MLSRGHPKACLAVLMVPCDRIFLAVGDQIWQIVSRWLMMTRIF